MSTRMTTPEMIEGLEAFTRFQAAMRQVLTVPSTEIKQRIAEEKQQSALNPNRRGPKPKKRSAPSRNA